MQLNRSFPMLNLIGKIITSVGFSVPIFMVLLPGPISSVTLLQMILPIATSLLAGWIGYQYVFENFSRLLFGVFKASFVVKKEGQGRMGCELQSTQHRAGLLSFLNINYPYKFTAKELNSEIYKKVHDEFLNNGRLPEQEAPPLVEQYSKFYSAGGYSFDIEEVKCFTRFYTKEIAKNYPQYFYENVNDEISTPEYNVDEEIVQYRKKRKIGI